MRSTILLAIAVLATALAGCSDPPPSGAFSFDSSAATGSGTIDDATYQDFEPAYDPTSGQGLPECPTEEEDPTGMLPVERCTRPHTTIHANFSDLPDPEGNTFTVFFVDSTGTNPAEEAGDLEEVHEMGGAWMGEFHYDNSGDSQCANAEDDSADDTCNKDNQFDTLELRLEGTPLARSDGMGQGSSFSVMDIHRTVSFEGSYSGSDFTVSVSGLDSNLTYTAWLIIEDEAGAVVHQESFAVSNGENTYEAEMDGDQYVAFHIHVTGTKINVAVGAIA